MNIFYYLNIKEKNILNQINDICSHCKEGILQYICAYFPYSEEHLKCNKCDSTYNIKYKQMWTEDIQNLAGNMLDVLEEDFENRGMKLTVSKENELYNKLQDLLEEFSTGDFKNQIG